MEYILPLNLLKFEVSGPDGNGESGSPFDGRVTEGCCRWRQVAVLLKNERQIGLVGAPSCLDETWAADRIILFGDSEHGHAAQKSGGFGNGPQIVAQYHTVPAATNLKLSTTARKALRSFPKSLSAETFNLKLKKASSLIKP